MPFTPPSNPSPDTLGASYKKSSGSDAVPQHATGDRAQESAEDGTQAGEPDQAKRAERLSLLEGFMRGYLLIEPSKKEVAAVLDVIQDDYACDKVMVCHMMQYVFGKFSEEDIAEVVRARDAPRHGPFEPKFFHTVYDCLRWYPRDEFEKVFGAKPRYDRWKKVELKYYERGEERDEADEEENCAWAIWNEAKTTLAELRKKKLR